MPAFVLLLFRFATPLQRSCGRRRGKCRSSPSTRGLSEKTEATSLDLLRPAILGRTLSAVESLARSPDVRPSRHGRPLAARTVSPVLGRSVEQGNRRRRGRLATATQIRRLIEEMAAANPLWRAPRIHGELKMLGIQISERTVSRILRKLPRPPSQTWNTFLHNHLGQMVSMDFLTVPTITMRVLFVFSCWNIVVARCCTSM
jgi:hypothetical protein